MLRLLKAIKLKNLDEAVGLVASCSPDDAQAIYDPDGEPDGLLTVLVEDRLPEEVFYRLFDAKQGVLVEVERIAYSGYGPPAAEENYMGYPSDGFAYVLRGCRYAVEIRGCPQGARDIHHLEAQVMDHQHPLNREDLAARLGLAEAWDFDDLFEAIVQGSISAQEIDRLIHQGIQ